MLDPSTDLGNADSRLFAHFVEMARDLEKEAGAPHDFKQYEAIAWSERRFRRNVWRCLNVSR